MREEGGALPGASGRADCGGGLAVVAAEEVLEARPADLDPLLLGQQLGEVAVVAPSYVARASSTIRARPARPIGGSTTPPVAVDEGRRAAAFEGPAQSPDLALAQAEQRCRSAVVTSPTGSLVSNSTFASTADSSVWDGERELATTTASADPVQLRLPDPRPSRDARPSASLASRADRQQALPTPTDTITEQLT
jgi:hypothetical protein